MLGKKIIGYKIKDSYLDEIALEYDNYKDICDLYEYMVYNRGIPEFSVKEYFNKNNIVIKEVFKYSLSRAISVSSRIIERIIKNKCNLLDNA